MAKDLYINDDQPRHRWLRRLLTTLLILVLMAGLLVGGWFLVQERRFDQYVSDYRAALDQGDFETAVQKYRNAQEKALTPGPIERFGERYRDIMVEIESLTMQRIDLIQNKMLAGQSLSSDDLQFAEMMGEVTAVHLVAGLRDMASRYLTSDISRPVLQRAFSQLAGLPNLETAVGTLPDQLPQMTEAAPMVSKAKQAQQNQDFWTAWAIYHDIVANPEWAGFVHEQTQLYIDDCRDEMYQPLMDDAKALMEGGRYQTAEQALLRLREVFAADQAIEQALLETRDYLPAVLNPWQGPVEFISVRPLIIRPDIAFDGDGYAATANDAMITATEFSRMIAQLYENDFILIDSDLLYDQERHLQPLMLPPGKKPIVLVIDALNYYASRRETGNAWDLVLNQEGDVCAVYPDEQGNMVVDRNGEMIGLLDQFVREHPDFSLNGAKGTISLTGYEGIFGKVTDPNQLSDRNTALLENGHAALELTASDMAAARDEAAAIIDRLRSTGWQFASSTYGYINASQHPMERITDDTGKWLDQVGSLTGPVSMLNYPNGAFIQGSDERAEWLREQGFILFAGQGTRAYFYVGQDYYYVDKTPINGFTLRNSASYELDRLFDAAEVYDAENRP